MLELEKFLFNGCFMFNVCLSLMGVIYFLNMSLEMMKKTLKPIPVKRYRKLSNN